MVQGGYQLLEQAYSSHCYLLLDIVGLHVWLTVEPIDY